MANLINDQVPNIPTPQQAVSIDKWIYECQLALSTRLSWLDNGWGRAYRNLKTKTGGRLYVPEVYVGKENTTFNYFEVGPDNDIMGSCFFYLIDPQVPTDFAVNGFNYYEYKIAVVFNVNLEKVNAALIETDYFEENLIQDVREAFTRQMPSGLKNLQIDQISREFRECYREFNIEEPVGADIAPMTCFRFDLSVVLFEDCEVELDFCQALQKNLSKAEKVCVIQSIDFTDPDFLNALSPEQISAICQ